MYSISKIKDTSTPKRRRLGTGRIYRSSLSLSKAAQKSSLVTDCSPITSTDIRNGTNEINRCDSPLLPCNQVEFRSICDSDNSNSISSCNIPCSPDILYSSVRNRTETEEWESLNVCTSKINEICEINNETTNNEIAPEVMDDISEDMFHSKLEQSDLNHVDKNFKDKIEKSFDFVNQSISNLDEVMKNKSSLFETRDSFLLDIKEDVVEKFVHPNQIVNECKKKVTAAANPINTFYGLPMIAKGLFKTYRNIEKFYGEYDTTHDFPSIHILRDMKLFLA